jgi:hypothetical protein
VPIVKCSLAKPARVVVELVGGTTRRGTAIAPILLGPESQAASADGLPVPARERDEIIAVHHAPILAACNSA